MKNITLTEREVEYLLRCLPTIQQYGNNVEEVKTKPPVWRKEDGNEKLLIENIRAKLEAL